MRIIDLACYLDSPLSITLIETPLNMYHKHVVLIQSIKDILLENNMFRVILILYEDNQSDGFMTKLSASINVDLLIPNFFISRLYNIIVADIA